MTADILFTPVCSNCGGIIYDQVDYRKPASTLADDQCMKNTDSREIFPSFCRTCGAKFKRIAIPTKLPYITKIHS